MWSVKYAYIGGVFLGDVDMVGDMLNWKTVFFLSFRFCNLNYLKQNRVINLSLYKQNVQIDLRPVLA